MKKLNFSILILVLLIFASCNKDDALLDYETSSVSTDNTTLSKRSSVSSPDWYHFKYIQFYDKWGIKITALIKDDNVIGVYSQALNRPDFTQVGYYWNKVYSSRRGEYSYRITLQYSLETQTLDWAWGVNTTYWWDAFGEDVGDEVDYFNGQTTTSITAGTSELTYWIKRSDANSMEYVADCINGNCPE